MGSEEATRGYPALREEFRWELPADLNIGVACADRHPDDRLALIHVDPDGSRRMASSDGLTGSLPNGSKPVTRAFIALSRSPRLPRQA